jgi:NhaP-type Na+/H+ and K+/H+ antiporters
MLTSLSLIFLVGLAMGAICQRLKLPRIIGMLATGIVLGPYVLDMLDPSILSISSELRKMALIIILIKAGLSLDLSDLKKAGRPAVLLSFVPATFELMGYIVCAPLILGVSRVDAAVMGAVLAAVSPAVVVPRMVSLIEKRYGTQKAIPQMILARCFVR